jgi:hypothetical protein
MLLAEFTASSLATLGYNPTAELWILGPSCVDACIAESRFEFTQLRKPLLPGKNVTCPIKSNFVKQLNSLRGELVPFTAHSLFLHPSS